MPLWGTAAPSCRRWSCSPPSGPSPGSSWRGPASTSPWPGTAFSSSGSGPYIPLGECLTGPSGSRALWACVLVLTGTYRALFTRVVYTEWIFFGLMAVGLFLFRRRPGVKRELLGLGIPPGAGRFRPLRLRHRGQPGHCRSVGKRAGPGFRASGSPGLLCLGPSRIPQGDIRMIIDFHNHYLPARVHRPRSERGPATSGSPTTPKGIRCSTPRGTTTSWSRATGTSSIGPGFWMRPVWTCRSSPSPAPAPASRRRSVRRCWPR